MIHLYLCKPARELRIPKSEAPGRIRFEGANVVPNQPGAARDVPPWGNKAWTEQMSKNARLDFLHESRARERGEKHEIPVERYRTVEAYDPVLRSHCGLPEPGRE